MRLYVGKLRKKQVSKFIKYKKYLGYFDYDSKKGDRTRQFNFSVTVKKPMEIRLQEHVDYAWVNNDALHDHPVTDNVKQILSSFWETNG